MVVYRLAHGFKRKGFRVSIITTNREKYRRFNHQGIPVYSLHSRYPSRFQAYYSLYNPQLLPHLHQLLSTLNPDVINFHNIHAHLSYSALKLAINFTSQVIFTGHDTMPFFYGRLTQFIDSNHDSIPDQLDLTAHPFTQLIRNKLHYNPFRNLIIKHFLSHYPRHLVVVSPLLQQLYFHNGISQTQVIYNGTDLHQQSINLAVQKKLIIKHNLTPKQKYLLLVGRIRPDKGSHLLLRALTKLPSTSLLVVGPNDWGLSDLTREAHQLKLDHRLIYLGNLPPDQLASVHKLAHVVCLPSICFDSFPNVALEAIACQVPVLISKFTGTADLLIDRHSAMIVNPFDLEALVDSLHAVLESDSLRKHLIKNAYHLFTHHFTLEHQLNRYAQLFNLD